MKCNKCGAEVGQGAAFCPHCGNLIETEKKCMRCGRPLNNQGACNYCTGKASEIACSYCGKPLNEQGVCNYCGRRVALASCPKCGGMIPESASICSLCGAVLRTEPARFHPYNIPEPKKNNGVLIGILSGILVVVVAVVVFIILWVTGVVNFGGSSEKAETTEQTLMVTPSPAPYETSTPFPTMTPASTPEQRPSPTPVVTPAPRESTYRVVVAHVTWEQARDAAAREGGHLVTFSDAAEFNKVVGILSGYSGIKNVWIGACAPAGLNSASAASDYWNSRDAAWITGEPFTFARWRSGEPSGYDAKLGVEERYIQIFCPKADGGEWSYNDAGNDLSEYKPNTLAYIIEWD